MADHKPAPTPTGLRHRFSALRRNRGATQQGHTHASRRHWGHRFHRHPAARATRGSGLATAGRVEPRSAASHAVAAAFRANRDRWEPTSGEPPAEAFDGATAVFHLAGEPVAGGRWTKARKQRIRDSRVIGTRNLVAALQRLPTRPGVLVSGSAVGYYGSRGDDGADRVVRSRP